MRSAWLARDRVGQLALFAGAERADDLDALEAEARVLAALAAREGTGWIRGEDDDAGASRVVVAIVPREREGGYRDAAVGIPVEDSVSGDWVVVREEEPRVLVSRRRLDRAERDSLRARDDCAAVLVERSARALARSRTDAVHVYVRGARAFERAIGRTTRPLRARAVPGRVARLPLEFASSAAVFFGEGFDGSTDGALRQTPERLGPLELAVNFVRFSIYVGFVGVGLDVVTHSLVLGVLGWIASAGAVTALFARGGSRSEIVPRPPPPTRVEPERVRVGADAEPEHDEAETRPRARERR